MAESRNVLVHHLGRTVRFVDREQLRFRSHGRQFSLPHHLLALIGTTPSVPSTFDWSKNESLKYPTLGNDLWGNCYYAAAAHGSQTYSGNGSAEDTFDVNALVARYKVISGGDNGLSDQQMMPEWEAGIIGPNGPHRIVDQMTINPNDDVATALAMWAFCGLIYTAALPDKWVADAAPGAVWDVATPNPQNGHAVFLTGKRQASGGASFVYDVRTWGMSPPIFVTPAGLKGSDPELIVAVSWEMFNAQQIAPCGLSYADIAALWIACGGKPLPPFGTYPNTPPTPPKPSWCHRNTSMARFAFKIQQAAEQEFGGPLITCIKQLMTVCGQLGACCPPTPPTPTPPA